jgi:cytochrome c553
MKRLLVIVVLLLLAALAAGAIFVATHKPAQRATTDLKIKATPERIARGEYLANHVSGCMHCHTSFDITKRSHPATGPHGAGGACWGAEMELPGTLCVPNITPDAETGLGAWTDDEILRAFREGVGRDGHALFPMMPYGVFREMSDEDAHSIVAYLRSIDPVRNAVSRSKIDFPVNFLIEFEPKPLTSAVPPPAEPDRGRYLTVIAGCQECHGADFSGGVEFATAAGVVRTANLTPGADGIVPSDAEDFIRIFRAYAEGELPPGVEESDWTMMGWREYSGMTDEDLRAIHAVLRSTPPVVKQIQTYGPAKSDSKSD